MEKKEKVINSKAELREAINNLKDGQILSIDFRGKGYKAPEDQGMFYGIDDPEAGDKGFYVNEDDYPKDEESLK